MMNEVTDFILVCSMMNKFADLMQTEISSWPQITKGDLHDVFLSSDFSEGREESEGSVAFFVSDPHRGAIDAARKLLGKTKATKS